MHENIDRRWSEIKIHGKNIVGRSNHSMIFYNDSMYLYGGYEREKGIFDDFYQL